MAETSERISVEEYARRRAGLRSFLAPEEVGAILGAETMMPVLLRIATALERIALNTEFLGR